MRAAGAVQEVKYDTLQAGLEWYLLSLKVSRGSSIFYGRTSLRHRALARRDTLKNNQFALDNHGTIIIKDKIKITLV